MARLNVLTVVLALAAAVLFAACGGDDDGGSGDGVPSTEGNSGLFTTAGFQEAVDAVTEKEGADASLFDVQITEGGAVFTVVDGDRLRGQLYTGGELRDQQVNVVGPGSLEGAAFSLSEVDPAALDRIAEGVQAVSGIEGIEITVLTLSKQNTQNRLAWTINAEGDGRTGLLYNADPDGSNVTDPLTAAGGGAPGGGATGTETTTTETEKTQTEPGDDSGGSSGAGGDGGDRGGKPSSPNARARQIQDCIQQAGQDTAALEECLQ